MSPFSNFLHELRLRKRISQTEFADLLGCGQSYVSALEVGLKGPPPDEFIARMISVLNLSENDQLRLREAVAASERKFVIDADAPPEVYELVADMKQRLSTLHPVQVRMIREILAMKEVLIEAAPVPTRRLKRRTREDARM